MSEININAYPGTAPWNTAEADASAVKDSAHMLAAKELDADELETLLEWAIDAHPAWWSHKIACTEDSSVFIG